MRRDRSIRSPRGGIALLLALTLAAALLLGLNRAGMLQPLRERASFVLAPLLVAGQRAGSAAGSLGGGDSAALKQRIADLEAENSALKTSGVRLQQLELENTRLREQVRIEKEQPWKLLGADIAARAPDNGRRLITLAVGTAQHVKVGMAVIARDGSSPPALIGVVTEVTTTSSAVLLITDYASAVSAQIFHQGGALDGIVQGQWQRGSRLTLEEVQRNAELAAGDAVVTAGLSAKLDSNLARAAIPPNVPIGQIEQVRADGRNRIADLIPFVDPDRINYVWVILSADE